MSARDAVHLTDEQLDDFADGAMDDSARASAEAHLAACARCRHAVDETRALLATATRERAAVTAPEELWPLVASSTIHLARVRRQVLASMRGVLIAGAIALVAATAVVTWKLARWTAPRVVPVTTVPLRAGGPGRHAGHAGHPTVPVPPRAPDAPQAPRP
jgi:predicted anti-sigma-YlaC factor YlaD